MRIGFVLSRTAGAAMMMLAAVLALPSTAAAVAIDVLTVDHATVGISAGSYTTTLIDGPVVPGVDIQMGQYQDPIVSGTTPSGVTWKIYSTGANGKPAPSGSVDPVAGGFTSIDLSSLQLSVTGVSFLPSPFDVPLWPVVTPPTSGSYDPATGAWSLYWNNPFTVTVTLGGLGSQSVSGNVAVTLSGTLTTVPVPAAAWLFGSGLLGLAGVARRRQRS